jgi:hypothetical protein
MKIGGRHRWRYDAGDWSERKVEPDRWEFAYAVPKRRAGHAPEGSGVPVGTEYHWYILAHQTVRKLDANTYTTAMAGQKYKLAHRRAGSEKWSASERAQGRRLVAILRGLADEVERGLSAGGAPPPRSARAQGAQGSASTSSPSRRDRRAPRASSQRPSRGAPRRALRTARLR